MNKYKMLGIAGISLAITVHIVLIALHGQFGVKVGALLCGPFIIFFGVLILVFPKKKIKIEEEEHESIFSLVLAKKDHRRPDFFPTAPKPIPIPPPSLLESLSYLLIAEGVTSLAILSFWYNLQLTGLALLLLVGIVISKSAKC